MSYKKVLVGDTIQFSWVNSGVTMNPVVGVYTGSDTLVDSGAMISSGDGHYYYNHTVNSEGYYNMVAVGSVSGNPYKRILKIKGIAGGVD